MSEPRFIDMIIDLRRHGRVVLYQYIPEIGDDENELVVEFLRDEYANESRDYPGQPPEFNSESALWAATTTFKIAQLILFRRQNVEEMEETLPLYKGPITPSTALSADLCLRFIPQMVFQLETMDIDDKLIGIVNTIMQDWPYSQIGRPPWPLEWNPDIVASDLCLRQLFTDRIIERRDIRRASLMGCKDWVASALGMYKEQIWKEFNSDLIVYESNGKTE